MSATYEPGTVAAIQTSVIADDGGIAVRIKKHTLTDEPVWMWLTNGGVPRADGGFVRDENVTDVRPVVVLDMQPHDAQAKARLLRQDGFNWLADQIEAQTRPPKPRPWGSVAAVRVLSEGVQA